MGSSRSRLALALTPGLTSRSVWIAEGVWGRRRRCFGPWPRLERCRLPAAVAQAVLKKQAFKRAEKELASIRGIENCRLVSRNDPEYPRTLRQIYDPPVLRYVRRACRC
jgi:predicted Rossmann fold nucleotide-binding protein DprA/Smf involved in DNA uptake